ncbi:phage tail tape measure protein [Streptomyces bauhiniae]|uniref:Phage tail tape measure protein n=1 Tax=Streptomyces bauhiniae TaxID=2340725 RepID=A0A7K3QRJ6_9ACTN|nr:phage tail tape measure protein [Streptomyces bauhiniae]NEB92453.1 phage tail tape measure protein [Streptomyces bauhiniae]
MATRTVVVRLRADVNQYTRGITDASNRTSQFAGMGAKVGTAMLAGFAVAAAAAARFDKAMSNVRAVTNGSSADMAKLRAAALEAGKSTQYSATQAADAEAELARAGVSVADITGGALKGSLALAAAGQMDLADAATISAQAMNTFGLKGKDVGHIADVLASGANKSAADMHGLGLSLRQGGLLAHQTGLSLEDTVGTLAAFADHALIGSDAGTSLKVMLQRLTPQSDEARGMMQRLGFTAYDAQGKFVGLTKLAGNMQSSFSKLTPEARNAAFATIFGSDAVRSATILYELGAKGISKYVGEVNDSGAAARTAAIQTDNLAGDMERLRGAIETALIEGGSAANGTLRGMVQWVTRVVDAYNDLPPSVQKGVTAFTGIGGAAALVASGIILLLPRIAATRTALIGLGVTGARVRTILMGLGRLGNVVAGLAVLSMAASALSDEFKDAPPNVSKMSNALVDLALKSQVAGELSKTFGKDLDGLGDAAARIAHPGTLDRIEDFFGTFDPGTDVGGPGLDKATAKIKAVDEALAQLAQSGNATVAAQAFDRLAAAAEKDGTSKEKLLTLLPQYSNALADADTQGKTAASGQAELAKQMGMTADEVRDQRTEAEKLSDALKTLNGASISAAEQEISFRQSLADLSKAVKDNGHSLDVTSEKGRKVKSAFLDAAKAAMDHAQAVGEQKNSQQAGQAVLEKDISLLKSQMRAAGFSKDAIEKLTSAYAKLPVSKETRVDAKTSAAMAELEAVKRKVASTKGKTLTMNAPTAAARAQLEALGFKIRNTKGKQVIITLPTGGPRAAAAAIQRAIDSVHGKTVGVGVYTTNYYKKVNQGTVNSGPQVPGMHASGGLIGRYAGGGAVQYIPAGGPVSGPGTGTSDSIPALISNGEYVIKAASVRKYGVAMFDRLNAGRYASGGLLGGFSYTPTGTPVLGGPGDAKRRYDGEIEDLKRAWDDLSKALKDQKKAADNLRAAEKNLSKVRHGHHTAAQLRAAEERVDKARSEKRKTDATVRKDRAKVNAADAELGLKKGAKTPKTFNLKAYETQLNESVAATEKWRRNLTKVGARGGKELQAMLEGMGEDGYALVNALAGASDKQFKSITDKLKKTGDLAKATLADFTKQLGGSTKESQQFAADLQKLAADGFGDLAQALAAQGDASAMTLAHQAATGSKMENAKANIEVGKAKNTLTGEDLANSLTLLTTLRAGPGRGFAELIAAGLDVATIRELVPKMTKQIKALPEANRATFVRQWNAQGGVAMASGGILSRPTVVLGGEAGVPESWIPWNGSARSRGLLAKTAASMGYQLTPAGRYQGGPSTTAVAREMTKHIEVHLHGAKQSTAEQAADVARYISFVG